MRAIKTAAAGRAVLLLFAMLLVAGACGDNKSDQQPPQPSPEARKETPPEPAAPPGAEPPSKSTPDQAAKPAPEQPKSSAGKEISPEATRQKPAPSAPRSEAPKPETSAPRTAPLEHPKPTPPVTTTPAETAQKPAAPARTAKDVVVLTGSPMGGVRLQHKLHGARAGGKCATCHHASRPEKPATAPQQACSDCHTKTAAPPMKTKYQGAFHNPTAQAGTCIDCHKAENAAGKKAPLKCTECHKKENG